MLALRICAETAICELLAK